MINERLKRIQVAIKAPKNQYNSFGKYKYRSAEEICEAVKPYLDQEGCSLTLSDDIIEVGGRVYVVATARLTECESGEAIEVHAMAREDEQLKGMTGAQLTGATSSYARKYALNGLLLLDDSKDPDTDEFTTLRDKANKSKDTAEKPVNEPNTGAERASEKDKGVVYKIFKDRNLDIDAFLARNGLNWTTLTNTELVKIHDYLRRVTDGK